MGRLRLWASSFSFRFSKESAELAAFLDELDGRGGVRDTEFVNFQLWIGLSFEVFANETSLFLFAEDGGTNLGPCQRRLLSAARAEGGTGGEFLRLVEACTGVSLE